MMLMTAKYEMVDTIEYEDFINNIFSGLKQFEKKNPDFKFTMVFGKDYVEVKTVKMNESAN